MKLLCITKNLVRILTRNAMGCNNRDDLLHLSFTLKISIFLYITQSSIYDRAFIVKISKPLSISTKKLHRRCSLGF